MELFLEKSITLRYMLRHILFPVSRYSSVTKIGENVFGGCPNLNKITVDKGNPVYHSTDDLGAIVEIGSQSLDCTTNHFVGNSETTEDDLPF